MANLRDMTPAQRTAYVQQQMAQWSARDQKLYNPGNVPPPGPGHYEGPYFKTDDGQWYKAPTTPDGAFVPSGPPPAGYSWGSEGYSDTPWKPPPPQINLGQGGAGPRFNMPGTNTWTSGTEGRGWIPSIDLSGDSGNPLGRRGLGNLDFSRPNLNPPTDPTTPTPDPAATTETDTKNKDDKGFDWKKILSTVGSNWKDIASLLTAAASKRAAGRALEAENARQEDDLNLRRAALGIRAPGVRAGQAAYGDFLANYQPIDLQVPGVAEGTSTGGWTPGTNARAAGTELSKQALEKLMSGEDLPDLSERPEGPNWVDDLLNYSGIATTGLAVLDNIRDRNNKPTTTNKTPLEIYNETMARYGSPTTAPGTTTPPPKPIGASAQGILDTGQTAAFGGRGRNPNWFMPTVK